jgi:hypothetical protein
MNLIGRLLSYDKCEVLITFMSSFVNRFNDDMREDALNDLFGTNSWIEGRQIVIPDERKNFWLNLYKTQLMEQGNARFVQIFEMVNQFNQTLYYLIFGTKSIKGMEVMKEAMYKVDGRGTYRFSDITDVNQRFLIDYTEDIHWVPSASERVFNHFRGQRVPITNVHDYVITNTPYIFRKSILKHLEQNNPPKIVTVESRRRAYSYPDGCVVQFAD